MLLVLMEALEHQKNILVLILLKQRQRSPLVCITMLTIVISLLTGKKYNFKANYKSANFPFQFCLGSISNKFY